MCEHNRSETCNRLAGRSEILNLIYVLNKCPRIRVHSMDDDLGKRLKY